MCHTRREEMNWMDRSEIVEILENRCGMACYEKESTDSLRDTLLELEGEES